MVMEEGEAWSWESLAWLSTEPTEPKDRLEVGKRLYLSLWNAISLASTLRFGFRHLVQKKFLAKIWSASVCVNWVIAANVKTRRRRDTAGEEDGELHDSLFCRWPRPLEISEGSLLVLLPPQQPTADRVPHTAHRSQPSILQQLWHQDNTSSEPASDPPVRWARNQVNNCIQWTFLSGEKEAANIFSTSFFFWTSYNLTIWELMPLNTKSTGSRYLEQNLPCPPTIPPNRLWFKHPSHLYSFTPLACRLLSSYTFSLSSSSRPVIKLLFLCTVSFAVGMWAGL